MQIRSNQLSGLQLCLRRELRLDNGYVDGLVEPETSCNVIPPLAFPTTVSLSYVLNIALQGGSLSSMLLRLDVLRSDTLALVCSSEYLTMNV